MYSDIYQNVSGLTGYIAVFYRYIF